MAKTTSLRLESLDQLSSASNSELVVQDDEEGTTDRQPCFTAVIDEAELPELIHEKIDPRPGCANHLRQVFLTDPVNDRFGNALLAKMGQQQENPSQTLLAGVENLVDEIRFVSDDAGKQMSDKYFRESLLFVEHSCHHRLLNLGKSAISY
jgi:hypothetical protein